MSAIASAIGFRRRESDGVFRFKWGSLSFKPGLGFGYSVYHEEASLFLHTPLFRLYVDVPMLLNQREDTEDWNASYGFTWFERSIHLNWRTWCKVVRLPWDYEWQKTEILDFDGNVVFVSTPRRKPPFAAVLGDGWKAQEKARTSVCQTFEYVYVRRPHKTDSGWKAEIQERQATVSVERRTWGLYWFPWRRWSRTSIDVRFNEEVGERTGSWKGGVTGCGYELREDETPHECLRRMERERRFE